MTEDFVGSEWPSVFDDLNRLIHEKGDRITVFERSLRYVNGHRRTRLLCTGLINEEALLQLKPTDSFGFQVRCHRPGEDLELTQKERRPTFSIWSSSQIIPFPEPLVLSWESGGKVTALPDPGFLATYDLMPRVLSSQSKIVWDRPEIPENDIVEVSLIAEADNFTESTLQVFAKRAYLEDYASRRNLAIVTMFLEEWKLPKDHELVTRPDEEERREEQFKQSHLQFVFLPWLQSGTPLHLELKGYVVLCRPGKSPITGESLGELKWPGIEKPVRGKGSNYTGGISDVVFVRDEVLAEFEGKSEFEVYPETGGVSLGNQWAVSFCRRYGRDLIWLELRKLYEGCPPWVIKHYHKYAVNPPRADLPDGWSAPNVAKRTERIISELCRLTNALMELSLQVLQDSIPHTRFMIKSPSHVKFHGWYTIEDFEAIARHFPFNATQGMFLSRSKDLYRGVFEKLSSGELRRLLVRIGIREAEIKEYGSLVLLGKLVAICAASHRCHLDIPGSGRSILNLMEEKDWYFEELKVIFKLNKLRILDAHRKSDTKIILADVLSELNLDLNVVASGYGPAFDALYDKIGEALGFSAETIEKTVSS